MSELKGLLETDEMFENEDSPSSTSLLLSMASQTGQSPPPAPSSTLFPFLWEMYKKNVDPIMKVVHVPSMESRFSSALLNPMQSAKGTTCLMTAIKFAAVLTLTDEQCWATMNSSREALLNSFRFEVLGALDDSKFLISHDLATLQAYVIFLVHNGLEPFCTELAYPISSPAIYDMNTSEQCGYRVELLSDSPSQLDFIEMELI